MGQVWVQDKWNSSTNKVWYVYKVEIIQTIFSEAIINE